MRLLSVLCNDLHHYIAHVRLPLNLEGFGRFNPITAAAAAAAPCAVANSATEPYAAAASTVDGCNRGHGAGPQPGGNLLEPRRGRDLEQECPVPPRQQQQQPGRAGLIGREERGEGPAAHQVAVPA